MDAATLFAPIRLDVTAIHAEALACNGDLKRFTKTLKGYLRARTGMAFAVRSAGRGTGREWVRVAGAAGSMTEAENAVLKALFPVKHAPFFGLNVRPTGGERVAILCAAAGVTLPEGFAVEPSHAD